MNLSGLEYITPDVLIIESIWAHFREDYPIESEKWLANLFITNKNRAMAIDKESGKLLKEYHSGLKQRILF